MDSVVVGALRREAKIGDAAEGSTERTRFGRDEARRGMKERYLVWRGRDISWYFSRGIVGVVEKGIGLDGDEAPARRERVCERAMWFGWEETPPASNEMTCEKHPVGQQYVDWKNFNGREGRWTVWMWCCSIRGCISDAIRSGDHSVVIPSRRCLKKKGRPEWAVCNRLRGGRKERNLSSRMIEQSDARLVNAQDLISWNQLFPPSITKTNSVSCATEDRIKEMSTPSSAAVSALPDDHVPVLIHAA
jgi:hypothetical protein